MNKSILLIMFLFPLIAVAQIKVDPSTDKVIIGNLGASPKAQLDVRRALNEIGQGLYVDAPTSHTQITNTYGALYLSNSNQTNNNFVRINFGDGDNGTAAALASKIKSHANNGGTLEFYTRAASGGGIQRRMGVNDLGKIYLGENPVNNAKVSISGSGEYELALNALSGNPDISFLESGNVKAQIRYNIAPQDFGFHLLNNKVMSVNTFGDLSINGQLTATSCNCPSDARLKKNIHGYDKGLKVIRQLNPVRFEYNENAAVNATGSHIGLIAQDLQQVLPELVTTKKYDSGLSYLNIKSSQLVYLLINGIKEQQVVIEAQENDLKQKDKEIKDLNNQMKLLESRIKTIEKYINDKF